MQLIPSALIKDLAERFGLSSEPEYFTGGHKWSDGTIYSVSHSGNTYLLKIIKATGEQHSQVILERLSWAAYLSSHGINTIAPLSSCHGQLVETCSAPEQDYCAFAWQKIPGETTPDLHPRDLHEFYRDWGSLLGDMHTLAKTYPKWLESGAQDDAGKALISQSREWEVFYNWIPDPEVKQAWLVMQARLDALPRTRDNFGMIHNDPHLENLMCSPQGLVLLDFDVANYLWFALEIAICIYSAYSRAGFHSRHKVPRAELKDLFVKPFLEGYLSRNKLPETEWNQIELFLNYRRILMFTVFYEQIQSANPRYLAEFKQEILERKKYLDFDIVELVNSLRS